MCKASISQYSFLLDTFNKYGAASGQAINLSKSSFTFGSKVNQVIKTSIQNKMGILKEGGADRVKEKCSGWYSRMLSQGGKEVLLMSIALAMPVFVMSCFKLPKTTCDNLASVMADFWWSSTEHSKNIHWLSWEKLCLPKDQGGLGFRNIQTFNQALLAKQAWRILQYPNCLFARMMKSRYFPQSHFLEATLGPRPSYAWRSILYGRDLLVQGLKKNVGNGKSFKVWLDAWIEDEEGWRAPWRMNDFFNPDLRVSELIDVESRS
ncbi:PREDICTED: uncharacterized protein LOC109129116 [Camelina sativa]|uniref:Uncharacterized protein LOC109129116 n=1 Tax=Camelina sativa TaxID=90675 RepID=A0ABM1QZV7_CAMSA|nr:PREDICTED: uncharacterized protein LOC109129116 [Camelina sativa]